MKHIRFIVRPESPSTVEVYDASCDCFITRFIDVASIGWGTKDEIHVVHLDSPEDDSAIKESLLPLDEDQHFSGPA